MVTGHGTSSNLFFIVWLRQLLLYVICYCTIATYTFGLQQSTTINPFNNNNNNNILSFDTLQGKHILVVGGSGRVGGSVTTQLLQHGATVLVGGTNYERYEQSKQRWKSIYPTLPTDTNTLNFCTVHRERSETIESVLIEAKNRQQPIDLIVHTAGPFQGKVKSVNGILEASIQQQIPYIDVCDDYCTAMAAKTKYTSQATSGGVPCIVSTGCWPGVSSLMAKSLVTKVCEQSNNNNSKDQPIIRLDDVKVDFSFFTAGSGGAGVTLLVATFLILSELATVIVNGRRTAIPAMQNYYSINFGPIIGTKSVSHLNLLETSSINDSLNVGNVASYFGTAPNFWNTLLGFMARTIPPSILANEQLMLSLSQFSLPIVRVVDYFAGATNAMRCDVSIVNNNNNNIDSKSSSSSTSSSSTLVASAIYGHENLEVCVGECITAFIVAALTRDVVPPGIWFPEEAIASSYVSSVLSLASIGAHTTDVIVPNKDTTTSGIQLQLQQEDVWGTPIDKVTVVEV